MPNFEIWVRFYFDFLVRLKYCKKTDFAVRWCIYASENRKMIKSMFFLFHTIRQFSKIWKKCNLGKSHYLPYMLKPRFLKFFRMKRSSKGSLALIQQFLITLFFHFLISMQKVGFFRECGNAKMIFITYVENEYLNKRKYLPMY